MSQSYPGRSKHDHKLPTLAAGAVLAALIILPSLGFAQVGLGSAGSYVVLAGSTITNTGATSLGGDVGISPGTSITGLPAGEPAGGTIHAGDGAAAQAQADLTTAYEFLAGMACNVTMSGVDLGGKTLGPGVYCFSSGAQLTGILTLDAQGDSAAAFVFQIASALTISDGSLVTLVNGAQGRHVWWQIGSSGTLGSSSQVLGNVLAHTSITLTTGASLVGRALAQGGGVTMDTNSIVRPGDSGTAASGATWGVMKSRYR
jgi:Ice-binding-like